jgi:hypothetical protein
LIKIQDGRPGNSVDGEPIHLDRQSHWLRCSSVRDGGSRPHIGAMNLDLSGDEAAILTQELHDIVENDRYPFSPRIRTLRGILAKLDLRSQHGQHPDWHTL